LPQEFRKSTTFLFETQRTSSRSATDASLMLRLDFNAFFKQQANPGLL
jgi:hypothetical protein